MVCIIATNHAWYKHLPDKLQELTKEEFIILDHEKDLTYERLQVIKPRYVFFPHWSYLIPADIYNNFECVIFHMTDVPFGRGGSPLQNLIARGIYETKISSLRCVGDIDAGPVYLKAPFFLHGTAEEIYMRAAGVIEEMIVTIIKNRPQPVEQSGEVVCFKRRKPEDGSIANLTSLDQLYDYIRMLDAEGYPNAFLETDFFRFEFQRASLRHGYLIADVKIVRREDV